MKYTILAAVFLIPLSVNSLAIQKPFMTPNDHGDIWSLCENPSSHLLVGYKDGVQISPEIPKTGSDIHVQVQGILCKRFSTFYLNY